MYVVMYSNVCKVRNRTDRDNGDRLAGFRAQVGILVGL